MQGSVACLDTSICRVACARTQGRPAVRVAGGIDDKWGERKTLRCTAGERAKHAEEKHELCQPWLEVGGTVQSRSKRGRKTTDDVAGNVHEWEKASKVAGGQAPGPTTQFGRGHRVWLQKNTQGAVPHQRRCNMGGKGGGFCAWIQCRRHEGPSACISSKSPCGILRIRRVKRSFKARRLGTSPTRGRSSPSSRRSSSRFWVLAADSLACASLRAATKAVGADTTKPPAGSCRGTIAGAKVCSAWPAARSSTNGTDSATCATGPAPRRGGVVGAASSA